ncbi:MAG TPA: hypothetical protein VEI02_05435 [Planctomycetota bacterium]|nr:hypothetical protein [Planctomycetota bacterium]
MTDAADRLREALVRRGGIVETRCGRPTLVRFAAGPEAEARTARARAAYFDRSPRGETFELGGADRAKYLHGQCTQDVKGKAAGAGGQAWLLDPRGRNLGALRFFVLDDAILVEADPSCAGVVKKRLRKFVITEDVTIDDALPAASWHVAGPQAAATLEAALPGVLLPRAEDHVGAYRADGARWIVTANEETGETGFDVRLYRDAPSPQGDRVERFLAALEAAGAAPAGDDAFEILRVEAGRPRYGVDVDEDLLPAETGRLDATVSFTKGCYAGQEVVAKQQYLGRPRKRLLGLIGEGEPLRPGGALRAENGGDAGVALSGVRSPVLGRPISFAVLKGPAATPGAVVLDADLAPWIVVSPPFVRRGGAG